MKHPKYWAERVRHLTDIVSGGIAALAMHYLGAIEGEVIIDHIPLAVCGLAVALVLWAAGSFVSKEMEGDE